MAITLKLIDTGRIETRKNGEISYASVDVELDGVVTGAAFRAKVGDEAIIIDGDTITVSDTQIEALRKANAYHAREAAKRFDADAAEIAKARAQLDGFIASKSLNAAAIAELNAHFTAAGRDVISSGMTSTAHSDYVAGVRAIVARHTA